MEIKSYKKLKSNVYEITFDNQETLKLYDDIILKYELLLNKKIDKKTLEKLINENNFLEAYYKSLRYLGIKMRSSLEIENYLKKYNYSQDVISYTIERLKKEGYINHENYAKAYINDSLNFSSNGPQKILASLKRLGIPIEMSSPLIDNIDSQTWQSKILKIITKKAKSNKTGEKLFKSKIYSYLISLGYNSEDIKSVLDDYHINDTNAFQSEADKMYEKLVKKFDGIELKLHFKNKMIAKGFDIDTINNYLEEKMIE